MFKQVLGGDPPPIAESWPDCPPDLAALIARCLAKDPAQRFGGFTEVAAELTPILARVRGAEGAAGAGGAGMSSGAEPAVPEAVADPLSDLLPAEEPGRVGEDTRPIPAEEVAAALEEEPPSLALEAPALRERQEVESTRIGEARWSGGSQEPADEPPRSPSPAVPAPTPSTGGLRAESRGALRRATTAVRSWPTAVAGGFGRLSGWWRRVKPSGAVLRWGALGLLATLAFVALMAVGWLAVQRAREGNAEATAPTAPGPGSTHRRSCRRHSRHRCDPLGRGRARRRRRGHRGGAAGGPHHPDGALAGARSL